jgi:16S rRNA (guanine(966)-N(2))-methyltransferase RsmD
MRVIAGEFRSRVLKSVPGLEVRPTPDRLREALFNVLGSRVVGAVFLDCYAGSGAVGIEALSRGAKRAVFIERSPRAVGVLRENLKTLGIEDRTSVERGAAGVLLKKAAVFDIAFDLAFIDPPYQLEDEYRASLEALSAMQCRFAIAQHATRFLLEETYGALTRTRVLRQGDNCLSFYSAGE